MPIIALKSAVSGTVWAHSTSPGQEVTEGSGVLIVESMKMEIPVDATCDGVVVWLKPVGESMNEGEMVATIETKD